MFDPMETLTFVAAKTEKIALGTCVIDMLFHNLVILGRQFATLDVLSNGRCICGLCIGWSKDEYMVSNVPFENRGARADEFIQVLTRIWTDDIVEFRGRYYNIPASKIGPKPIQKPRIPIYRWVFFQHIFKDCQICGWVAASSSGFFRLYHKRYQDSKRERREGKQTSGDNCTHLS
ncbi:LLM class flavin-dependent oxidoreductase [Nitrososphaera sp. AFS]|uniref:LLM class flavin-dependent oxidoreductase n=1 Tax=Nitrososphaera sp. AFS TaxID=2301191 RepID=UPI00351AEDA1